MAKDAADIAFAIGFAPFFVAENEQDLDKLHLKEVIHEAELQQYYDAEFVIGIGDNDARQRIACQYKHTLNFTNLIHPSATFGYQQRSQLDSSHGCIVGAGVNFTNSSSIGDHTIINQGVLVAHDVIVEAFVNVAPGAIICGNVHLKKGAWIGAGAIVNQGSNKDKIVVGENVIIGSGAVVVKSCLEPGTYVGVPAKKI